MSSPVLHLSERQSASWRGVERQPVVGMYTPLWYAARVLHTTGADWWEGGVPPARGRRQRASAAVAQAAARVVRHMKPVRAPDTGAAQN